MSQENNLFFCKHMHKTIELLKLYFYIFFDLWYRKEEGHLTWVSKEGTLLKILQWPIWEKNLKRSAYMYMHACVQNCLSRVWLFVTLWTVTCQPLLSIGFSRQEYWSGLPCPPPGDLLDPGVEAASPVFPALAGGFFTAGATWEAMYY